jgi:hypothetical protein
VISKFGAKSQQDHLIAPVISKFGAKSQQDHLITPEISKFKQSLNKITDQRRTSFWSAWNVLRDVQHTHVYDTRKEARAMALASDLLLTSAECLYCSPLGVSLQSAALLFLLLSYAACLHCSPQRLKWKGLSR